MRASEQYRKKRSQLFSVGANRGSEFFKRLILYILLIGISYLFIFPLLNMVSKSFMSPEDLTDPSITWLPTTLYLENYVKAFKTLDFVRSFLNSLVITVVSAVLQTAVSAVTAYGLARFRMRYAKALIVIILLTYMIPVETTLIPRYVLFNNYKLLDTPLSFWLTSLFGQGIKSSLFILVFYQIFSNYSVSIDEAAAIDGAGYYKIFRAIALPIARSGIILTFLFSFVWYWNETRQAGLYFGNTIKTLPMKLGSFAASYQTLYEASESTSGVLTNINEAITLAGTMLSILPIMIMYIALQKQFVESIEKSGITGE